MGSVTQNPINRLPPVPNNHRRMPMPPALTREDVKGDYSLEGGMASAAIPRGRMRIFADQRRLCLTNTPTGSFRPGRGGSSLPPRAGLPYNLPYNLPPPAGRTRRRQMICQAQSPVATESRLNPPRPRSPAGRSSACCSAQPAASSGGTQQLSCQRGGMSLQIATVE